MKSIKKIELQAETAIHTDGLGQTPLNQLLKGL